MLYIDLTVVLFGLLLALWASGVDEEMSPYQAFAHALTTIPTAGFSTKADSIEASRRRPWLLVVFMVLGGFNFALMYRALVRRQPRTLVRDGEARLYAVAARAGLGDPRHRGPAQRDVLVGMDGIRVAVFTAVSTMTTTGFSVADYNTWPALAMMTIVGLMFVGGSAGFDHRLGLEVVRHLLLGKILRREIDQTLHPELVVPVGEAEPSRRRRAHARAISSFILSSASSSSARRRSRSTLHRPSRRSPFDAVSVSASMLANVGPAFEVGGPLGAVRALQRLLHAADERPDVARPARDRPDRRARLAPLLAQRLARQQHPAGASSLPGSSTASTWSRPDHGRVLSELGAALAHDRDQPRALRQPEAGDALARSGRVALDLELDDLEVLLAQLEQVHDPVLGHLVLDEAEHIRGRADRLVDPEQVEVLLVAGGR